MFAAPVDIGEAEIEISAAAGGDIRQRQLSVNQIPAAATVCRAVSPCSISPAGGRSIRRPGAPAALRSTKIATAAIDDAVGQRLAGV